MNLCTLLRVGLATLSLAGCSLSVVGQPTSSALPPSITATTSGTMPTALPHQTQAPPPQGSLQSGTESIDGWQGSYCWKGTCADVAGIPNKADLPELRAANGQVEFSLSDGATFIKWQVLYGDGSDSSFATLAEGGEGFDPDTNPATGTPELTSVAFAPPESGDWVVLVTVWFPDGDLSYAWRVIVP